MFDIGALELLLIGVVALIVVGPERLPKLARTAGLWVGRARRAFTSVKEEIDREIKAEELKEILRKQAESRPLDQILEEETGLAPKRGADATSSPQGPSSSSSAATRDVDASTDANRARATDAASAQSGNGPADPP